MAHWVNKFAMQAWGLNLIPGIHVKVKGENWLQSGPPASALVL